MEEQPHHACNIVTRKEIAWKRRNFFCLSYISALTSAQPFQNIFMFQNIPNPVLELKSNELSKLLYLPGVYILRVPQGDDGVLNGVKTLRKRIIKDISVYEIHYSKYQKYV